MNESKMKLEPVALMIVAVIFGAIVATFLMAVLAEVALPDGYVRYVALALFVGAGLICARELSSFLNKALYEWGSSRDLVSINKQERILIRSDNRASLFKELDGRYLESVWVPSRPVDAQPLDDAVLEQAFYNRLSNGGNSQ
jgi:hypothetical protein